MNNNVYGIDLGTSNLKVFSKSNGKIFMEKNTIAIRGKDEIFAYGDKAYAMYEKAPESIQVVFPVTAYYNIVREFPTGKGFADMVFIPRANAGSRPAMVIELKYDKTADTAIRQIKDKRYTGALSGYHDKILLVGINYDPDNKSHSCEIEEWENRSEVSTWQKQ